MAKKRATRKKRPSKKKPAPRDAWAEFNELLERWKKTTEDRRGIVSAIDASPAMRGLVEHWAGLAHGLDVKKAKGIGSTPTILWRAHSLNLMAAADQIGLDPHVLLRVFDRARQLGVIYPDGSLHPSASQYLTERDVHAVIPPMK